MFIVITKDLVEPVEKQRLIQSFISFMAMNVNFLKTVFSW